MNIPSSQEKRKRSDLYPTESLVDGTILSAVSKLQSRHDDEDAVLRKVRRRSQSVRAAAVNPWVNETIGKNRQ